MSELNKERIGTKNWVLIWIIGLAGQLCWNVENSWFNTFITEHIAPDASIIAWMVSISAVCSTIATFLVGVISDRLGKRRIFIGFGYILWGIFTIAFGTAAFIPANRLILATVIVVFADAVMSFFGSVGNDAAFSSWTTDITNKSNRGQLGGAIAAMPVLATIVGTLGGGIIIEAFGYFSFFTIIGVFVLAIGASTLIFLKDSPHLKPHKDEGGFWRQLCAPFNFRFIKKNKQLLFVCLIMGVYFSSFNIYFPHIGNYIIYNLGFSESNAGLIQGAGLLLAIGLSLPMIYFNNREKNAPVCLAALAAGIAGLIIVPLANNIPLLIIGMLLAGFGFVTMTQTLTAWSKNLFPEKQRGQFEGVRMIFAVLLPMVIGSTLSVPIINAFGLETTVNGVSGKIASGELFYISAAISVLTVVPIFFAAAIKKKEKAAASQSAEATADIDNTD